MHVILKLKLEKNYLLLNSNFLFFFIKEFISYKIRITIKKFEILIENLNNLNKMNVYDEYKVSRQLLVDKCK